MKTFQKFPKFIKFLGSATLFLVAFFVSVPIVSAAWTGPNVVPPGNNPPGFINNAAVQQNANFNILGTGQANIFTANILNATSQICLGSGANNCKTSWNEVNGVWLVDTNGIHYNEPNKNAAVGADSSSYYKLLVAGGNKTAIMASSTGLLTLSAAGQTAGYFVGSSYGVFSAGGLNYFNGSVGIAEANPQTQFHVTAPTVNGSGISWLGTFNNGYNGAVNNYGVGIQLKNSSYVNSTEQNKWVGLAAVAESTYSNNTGLAVYTVTNPGGSAPTEKFRVTGSGNVGVGTTGPTQKLEVAGNIKQTGSDFIVGPNSSIIRQQNVGAASDFTFLTSGQAAANIYAGGLYISNSYAGAPPTNGAYILGRVGIGTQVPSAKLEVTGDSILNGKLSYGLNLLNIERVAAAVDNDPSLPMKSGFFEAVSNSANWPYAGGNYWHLINTRHSNINNNYQMQLVSNFYDNDLWFRNIVNGSAQPWKKMAATSDIESLQYWASTTNNGIYNKNTGNVGVGTNSPTAKLDVNGNVFIDGDKSIVDGGRDLKINGWVGVSNNANANAVIGSNFYLNGTGFYYDRTHAGRGAVGMGLNYPGLGDLSLITSPGTASVADTAFTPNYGLVVKNSGNVGIGTTDPAVKLHVVSSADFSNTRFEGNGAETNVALKNTSSGGRSYSIISGGSGGSFSGGKFGVYDNNASVARLAIDINGNVGIGTTAPNQPLTISANNAAINLATTGAGGIPWWIFSTNSTNNQGGGKFLIYRPNSDGAGATFTIEGATGNVGLGNTVPNRNLTVTRGMNVDQDNNTNISGNFSASGRGIAFGGIGSGEGIASNRAAGSPNQYGLDFYLSGIPKISINGGVGNTMGNVGIGGVTNSKARLEVGATSLTGSAHSANLRTNAGTLSNNGSEELPVASFGFNAGNSEALGIRAVRLTAGSDWTTTAIGLTMDVDNTPRPNSANLWLSTGTGGTGGVGINTYQIGKYKLYVGGDTRVGRLTVNDAYTLPELVPSANSQAIIGDTDGTTRWASVLTGSGTSNYVPKWLNNSLTSTSTIVIDNNRVGISMGVPDTKLDVYDTDLRFQASSLKGKIVSTVNKSGASGIYLGGSVNDLVGGPTGAIETSWGDSTTNNNPQIGIGVVRNGLKGNIVTDYNGKTIIRSNQTNLVTVIGGGLTSGNVGIGVDDPQSRLAVSGNLTFGNNLRNVESLQDADDPAVKSKAGIFEASPSTTSTNWPWASGSWWHLLNMAYSGAPNYQAQLAANFWGNDLYFRNITNGTAAAWKKLASADDIIDSQYWSLYNGNIHNKDLTNKIGIGLVTPLAKFHIQNSSPIGSQAAVITGTNQIIASANNNYLAFKNGADNGTSAGVIMQDNNNGGYVIYHNYDAASSVSDSMVYGAWNDHIFQTGSSEMIAGKNEVMRIKQSGKVGIGKTDPDVKLVVGSGTGSGNIIGIEGADDQYTGLSLRASGPNEKWFIGMDNATANNDLTIKSKIGTSEAFIKVDESYGNVGIGTSIPQAKLDIKGNIKIADGTQGVGKVLTSNANGLASWVTPTANPGTGTNNYLPKWNNNILTATSLVYDNGNNVGIGTTAPTSRLHVYGNSYGENLKVESTSAISTIALIRASGSSSEQNWRLNAGTNGVSKDFAIEDVTGGLTIGNSPLYIKGSGQKQMLLLPAGGNVGIGDSFPAGPLLVRGTDPNLDWAGTITAIDTRPMAAGVGARIILGSNYNSTGNYTGGAAISAVKEDAIENNSAYALTLSARANGSNIFERMRITSNGNVGIGLTNPGAKLDVNGDTRLQGKLSYGSNLLNVEGVPTSDDPSQGMKSGFFEAASNSANWPFAGGSWWHLVNVRHSSVASSYQMQLASNFWGNDLYFRNVAAGLAQSWKKIASTDDISASQLWATTTNGMYNRDYGFIGIGTNSPQHAVHAFSATQQVYFAADAPINKVAGLRIKEGGLDKWFIYKSNDGNGDLAFANSAANISLFLKQNNGNVGVGMTSPDTKLVIAGEGTGLARIGGNTGCSNNFTGISLNGSAFSGCTNYNIVSSPTYPSLYLNRPAGNDMYFREQNADQMVIKTGGNVGIGTASPGVKLDVGSGLIRTGGTNAPVLAGQGAYLGWNATDALGETDLINQKGSGSGGFNFYNSGDTSKGNLIFKVNGSGDVLTYSRLIVDNTSVNAGSYANSSLIFGGSGSGEGIMSARAEGAINRFGLDFFTSSGTKRMSITNGGNVGIGTATPGAKLEVAGQVKITGGSPAAGKVLTSDASGLASWTALAANPGTGTNNYLPKWNSNALTGTSLVYDNGTNVGIGTSAPGYKLDVGDGLVYPSVSNPVALRISSANTGASAASLILSNSTKTAFNDGLQIIQGAGSTKFNDLAGTNVMTFNLTDSNVGFGTASPSTNSRVVIDNGNKSGITLTLKKPGGSSLQFESSSGYGYQISGDTSGNLMWYAGGAAPAKMTLDPSGNVALSGSIDGYKLSGDRGPKWDSAYALTSAADVHNTANTLVIRNSAGDFDAGTVTVSKLNSNGDIYARGNIAVDGTVDGIDISAASEYNHSNALVKRNAAGDFDAGTVSVSRLCVGGVCRNGWPATPVTTFWSGVVATDVGDCSTGACIDAASGGVGNYVDYIDLKCPPGYQVVSGGGYCPYDGAMATAFRENRMLSPAEDPEYRTWRISCIYLTSNHTMYGSHIAVSDPMITCMLR